MARRHPARTCAALLALALAAAACGGGDDAASGDVSASAAVVSPDAAPADPPSASPPAGTVSATPPASSPASSSEPITLAFAGDVHFEGVSRAALSGGLASIAPALRAADLTVVNLETAITERGTPVPGKQYVFRAPTSGLTALKDAGVDVVTLANNHGMDYGQVGLQDTLAAARQVGLPLVGAGQDEASAYAPHVATVKGRRVAVLGATQVLDSSVLTAWTAAEGKPGLASAKEEERLVEAVRAARGQADVVVVHLHWGTEQEDCATGVQQSLAQQLAEAGADAVVGSHAHVLLGGGWLGRTYVDYGLGNFVFYARTAPTQATGVLALTVEDRVTTAQWTPARISDGVPVPLLGGAAEQAVAAKERLRGCTGLAATPG